MVSFRVLKKAYKWFLPKNIEETEFEGFDGDIIRILDGELKADSDIITTPEFYSDPKLYTCRRYPIHTQTEKTLSNSITGSYDFASDGTNHYILCIYEGAMSVVKYTSDFSGIVDYIELEFPPGASVNPGKMVFDGAYLFAAVNYFLESYNFIRVFKISRSLDYEFMDIDAETYTMRSMDWNEDKLYIGSEFGRIFVLDMDSLDWLETRNYSGSITGNISEVFCHPAGIFIINDATGYRIALSKYSSASIVSYADRTGRTYAKGIAHLSNASIQLCEVDASNTYIVNVSRGTGSNLTVAQLDSTSTANMNNHAVYFRHMIVRAHMNAYLWFYDTFSNTFVPNTRSGMSISQPIKVYNDGRYCYVYQNLAPPKILIVNPIIPQS